MLLRFTYHAVLTPDNECGGYVVTFPDLPEAVTQGETVEQSLEEAVDCLDEAIAARIDDAENIPTPSPVGDDGYKVAPSLHVAIKAALHLAVMDAGISKRELGRRLGVDEKSVRRLLDPHYCGRLAIMEKALRRLGRTPELIIN